MRVFTDILSLPREVSVLLRFNKTVKISLIYCDSFD